MSHDEEIGKLYDELKKALQNVTKKETTKLFRNFNTEVRRGAIEDIVRRSELSTRNQKG